MTETTTTSASAAPAAAPRKRTSGALGGKVLAELQEIAAELGIEGAQKLRKGALIDAIKIARGDAGTSTKAAVKAASAPVVVDGGAAPEADVKPVRATRKRAAAKPAVDAADSAVAPAAAPVETAAVESAAPAADAAAEGDKPARSNRSGNRGRGRKAESAEVVADQGAQSPAAASEQPDKAEPAAQADAKGDEAGDENDGNRNRNRNRNRNQRDRQNGNERGGNDRQNGNDRGQDKTGDKPAASQGQQDKTQGASAEDDDENRRSRNRRGRNRQGGRAGIDVDTSYTEDDVLVPAAGILDVLDNYAFVRTTGYLPSENDVYVSLSMVRKWGLRRGDAVVGQVRQPREGERREKFNPMVKIDSVNGMTLDDASKRPEYAKLTPVHPADRIRLTGDASTPTAAVIDRIAPLGKGQRGLIVSPAKGGKTATLSQLADVITSNNPECHLMVVLLDERPEEVTDFQRSVKGEVIASTFDRPVADHITVAELSIERAKRLVELGHDVILLVDGISRLGRAYSQAAAASSRSASAAHDAAALHPAKKFFGAARNIEDGGSLTMIATVAVETGSSLDEAILDEFVGTANWELRLSSELAASRTYPAIDVAASGTRHEEALLAADEVAALATLRTKIAGLDAAAALKAVSPK